MQRQMLHPVWWVSRHQTVVVSRVTCRNPQRTFVMLVSSCLVKNTKTRILKLELTQCVKCSCCGMTSLPISDTCYLIYYHHFEFPYVSLFVLIPRSSLPST